MEFDEVREYVARRRRPHHRLERHRPHRRPLVKKFIEERELTVMLLVDVCGLAVLRRHRPAQEATSRPSSPPCSPSRRSATTTASAWSSSPTRSSSHPAAQGAEPRAARHPRGALLRAPRARHPPRAGAGVPQPRRAPAGGRLPRSATSSTRGFERPLAGAARRHDLIARRHRRPARATSGRRAGLIEWTDAETGERRLVDTSSPEVRRALAEAWSAAAERDSRDPQGVPPATPSRSSHRRAVRAASSAGSSRCGKRRLRR